MTSQNLIDTHCHLDNTLFAPDFDLILQRATDNAVSDIIIPAIAVDNWEKLKSLSKQNKNLHVAYGLHPMFMPQHCLQDLDLLEQWLQSETAIAVGECGLDFFIFDKQGDHQQAKKAQQALFNAQLDLAQQYKLPVIIHSRKSLDLVLKEIRPRPDLHGVIHSFSGSLQQAHQLIDQGFYLGFGGPITYTRAKKLRHLISSLPLDALLLETDAPDQPDAAHYGRRNEPAFLINIAQTMAELRKISLQKVASATTKNAHNLFNLRNR
ncbi:MAG: TatD family hydrolase [Cocleimonas sp.]|nr:TatD family hydrolase [Cocleimonas sp.]